MDKLSDLARKLKPYFKQQRWVYPTSADWVGTAGAPLTSTAWDGDSFSTTAKTLIDLSAVFGVPAGVKAVDVKVMIRDSASGSYGALIVLSPNSTSYSGKAFQCGGLPNDSMHRASAIVPCNSDGDIYYQLDASGAGTLDVWIEIWGYQL